MKVFGNTMLARDDIIELYQLVLDRKPESDQVTSEKRRVDSLANVALGMLMSEEFINNNRDLLAQLDLGE